MWLLLKYSLLGDYWKVVSSHLRHKNRLRRPEGLVGMTPTRVTQCVAGASEGEGPCQLRSLSPCFGGNPWTVRLSSVEIDLMIKSHL